MRQWKEEAMIENRGIGKQRERRRGRGEEGIYIGKGGRDNARG